MVRTQIYLTEEQRAGLSALAKSAGRKQSELIRDAIDRMLDDSLHKREALKSIAGMWKSRTDLPDFNELRRSWDRD